jgi:hypothetical protein
LQQFDIVCLYRLPIPLTFKWFLPAFAGERVSTLWLDQKSAYPRRERWLNFAGSISGMVWLLYRSPIPAERRGIYFTHDNSYLSLRLLVDGQGWDHNLYIHNSFRMQLTLYDLFVVCGLIIPCWWTVQGASTAHNSRHPRHFYILHFTESRRLADPTLHKHLRQNFTWQCLKNNQNDL